MGREGRAVGRMNGAGGDGFKWVNVVWLSVLIFPSPFTLFNLRFIWVQKW